MTNILHNEGIDKQVDDLRDQIRLLQQDRRANIDLLDANKIATSNEIRLLKEDNAKLRTKLANLQKNTVALRHDLFHSDSDGVKKAVLQKRNEFDTHKSLNAKLSAKLKSLTDEATICRVENQRPNHEGEPVSKQTRSLESKIDASLIQYSEAQVICNTYEHIVKRLKDEKVSFDNQLTALERTLESKHQDYEELLLISGDANHAREIALQNLQKSKCELEENKSKRSRDLRERQQHTKVRKQMLRNKENCDDKRGLPERENSLNGGCLSDCITHPVPIGDRSDTNTQLADQQQALDIYEAAFRKIKDVTGVVDVNDMICKIVGQESTAQNVKLLTAQNQIKIEELIKLRNSLAEEVDKMKHINSADDIKHFKIPVELQDFINLRMSSFERIKAQFDHITVLILSIKAGVDQLREKLTVLPNEDNDEGHQTFDEYRLPEIIRYNGNIMSRNHDILKKTTDDKNEKAQIMKFTKVQLRESLQNRRPMTHGTTEERQTSYNLKNRLARGKVTSTGNYVETDTDINEFETDEEMSRDNMKRASSNIIALEERRILRMKNAEG